MPKVSVVERGEGESDVEKIKVVNFWQTKH